MGYSFRNWKCFRLQTNPVWLQDGNVYVLMNQAGKHELPIINKRLAQAGLHVTRVSGQEEDALLDEASEQVAAESHEGGTA